MQEEITNTMNMMKARLDKELAGHAETRRQLEDLLSRVEDIRSQVEKIKLRLFYLLFLVIILNIYLL